MSLLGGESTESRTQTESRPAESAASGGEQSPSTGSTTFRLARLLFGGVLAFMAVDNFRSLEETVAYAESKGAPNAETTVPALSGSLLFGGLGIAAWKLPRLAAGAAATFLASATPVMHDFWAIEDDGESEQELIHFLKNVTLLGAALAFLRIGRDDA